MSSCGHHKSASAVTTTNWLKGANDSKRDSVCSATVLPAKVRYCLGSEPPILSPLPAAGISAWRRASLGSRSEEHTSELQSRPHLVCRLLLEKKKFSITCLSV